MENPSNKRPRTAIETTHILDRQHLSEAYDLQGFHHLIFCTLGAAKVRGEPQYDP